MNEEDSSSSGASLLWLIGGGIVGALLQPGSLGAAAGAALGYALGQIVHLKQNLQRVNTRLHLLEVLRSEQESGAAHLPEPETRPAPAALEQPVIRAAAAAPVIPPEAAEFPAEPEAMPPPQWEPPAPAESTWLDRGLLAALNWFKGGNPLARAGIVVLFFGGAFLAKYAAEHSHFPIELRFIGIAAVALTLLVFGWRLRDARSAYAQTLQGGGVAGLYLTIFAATRLYELLPPVMALGLMVIVAVTSAILAVAQNALALAVIGTAGGFMAPILISTGSANHIALFTYYAVLNLGIFTVAWFRAWRVLNLVGFAFTFGITGAFRALSYTPADRFSTDLFVGLFFLMYVAISVLFSLRQKPDLKGYVSASLVFGLPLAAFGIHGTLVSHIEYAMAWSALGLGGFYLALAWGLFLIRMQNLHLLSEAFAALGIIFASLAVPLAFDAQTTAATWAVEGAGLLWIGLRQDRRLARAFGMLLQLLGGLGYLYGLHDLYEQGPLPPVLNSATLGSLMLALAGLLSGLWLFRKGAALARHEQGWDSYAAIWGLGWWLLGGLSEIQRSLPLEQSAGTVCYLVASALLLHLAGARLHWPLPKSFGLMLMPVAALTGLVASLRAHHPLSGWMTACWPLLLGVQYLLLWREDDARKTAAADEETVHKTLHVGSYWLLALLATWEIHWRVQLEVSGVWHALVWGLMPAVLLWPLARRPLRPAWPLARHEDSYRVAAGAALAGVVLLWVLLINLGSRGDPAPLPYLPLLNPLDVGVMLALGAVLDWWLGLGAAGRLRIWDGSPRTPQLMLAALVFLWLNAALIRALHYLADAPLNFHGAMHSVLVQAALSVFWGLLGFSAMTLAARRAQRELWIAGAVLMGVVVAKLFMVDLSGTGTLARIVSFLIVGGLLVVTGYLSPLPPRDQDTSS